MRSAIFSIVSGVVLTLLLRGPEPPRCPAQATAVQDPAVEIPAQVIEALRDSFPDWLAGQDIPGAAVGLLGREGTLWQEEYGVTTRGGDAPISEETVFGIPSMSKSFTALAAKRPALDFRGAEPTYRNMKVMRRPR